MDQHQERVLREVVARDIRFVRLWFTDVAGVLKSLVIDPGELEDAFTEDIGFNGSSVEGLTHVRESDMLLILDAQTFQFLPWRNAKESVAGMFCDVCTPDRQKVHLDPRAVLQHAVERVRALGFIVMVYPEIELYLLRQPVSIDHTISVDNVGYFDHAVHGDSNDFRRQAVRMLKGMGITVEFSYHEDGPGQNEIDLRTVDTVTAAGSIMTARTVTEGVALRKSLITTFIPKPFIDHPGSGIHTHISLFEGDENTFYGPSSEYQLSLTGKRFIAGLLEHAYELAAVTSQHVSSYKCLWGGAETPAYVCWGHNNDSALVRVPPYKPDKRRVTRIEYRTLDPTASLYLALAVLIVAGLDGVEKKCELMPEAEGNVWDLTDRKHQVLGIRALPSSLSSAARGIRESDLVTEALGEEVFVYVVHSKEKKWHEYRRQVTPQEIRQFFRVY